MLIGQNKDAVNEPFSRNCILPLSLTLFLFNQFFTSFWEGILRQLGNSMNHICSSLELSLTLMCFNPNILYVNVESRAYHIYLFPQLLALHSDFRFFRNPIYLAAFFVFFTTLPIFN